MIITMRTCKKKRMKNILRFLPILLVLLMGMASCAKQPAAFKEGGLADVSGAFSLSTLSIQGGQGKGFYPGDLIRANIRIVNSSDVSMRDITVELDMPDFFAANGATPKIIIDNLEPGQEKEIESDIHITKASEEDRQASIVLVVDRGKQSEHTGDEIIVEVLGTSVYARDQIPIIGLHAIEDSIEIPIELYTSHFEALCKTCRISVSRQ
jgi:hypothetical protein